MALDFETSANGRSTGGTAIGDIGKIRRALQYYPNYIVLRDAVQGDDPDPLVSLVASLSAPEGATAERIALEDVSFTEVRVDAEVANTDSSVTHFSRTHEALAAHTDSSYMERPHELMVLQCVEADAGGGDSIMTPLADILRMLDERHAARLREPVFPFGDDLRPILTGAPGDERIRYYRAQLDRSIEEFDARLSPAHIEAIDALDGALTAFADDPGPHRFRLAPGDILLMHNHKAFHGRTGFAQASNRLLYRVRHHAESLRAVPHRAAASAPASTLAPDAAPQDIRAHLDAARRLERDGDLTGAIEEAGQAVLIDSDNSGTLARYGELLIRAGRFDEAEVVFDACHQLDPDNYDYCWDLSALRFESGRKAEARALIEHAVARHPHLAPDSADPAKPSILRTVGFGSSLLHMIQYPDGTYASAIKGGHFSLDHLFDESPYNLGLLNILDDNLDRLDAEIGCDLVLNTIACPDKERGALLALARFLDARPDMSVINDPRAVLQTARERNAARLGAIPGVTFPLTERLRWMGGDPAAMEREILGFGFRYPVILRKSGSQTGYDTILARSPDDLFGYFENADPGSEHYAIQFRDLRSKDGLYHKTRVFFIDGRFHPVANLYHDDWSVHSGDRYSVMQDTPWTQDEERAFLADPIGRIGEAAYTRLLAIRDAMRLDFFGVDFTVLEDGSLYVFEANPAMRHNFDHAGPFPYTRPNLEKITAAFEAMVARCIAD